jgi:hypothetical protein
VSEDASVRDEPTATVRRERSFRGISERLAAHYLSNLGGERVDDGDGGDHGDDGDGGHDRLAGDDWTAAVSSEKVAIGPSIELTEVTVVLEGPAATVDPLMDEFARKAMRAGG